MNMFYVRNKDNEHKSANDKSNGRVEPSEERMPQDKDLTYIYGQPRNPENNCSEQIEKLEESTRAIDTIQN